MQANGTFEVKISREEASALGQEAGVGRMTIDKLWSGDIQGSSKGEMLTGTTDATGSMSYCAMEHVTATLDDKSGSFYLMHCATMMRSDPAAASLRIEVVPGSGTGQLAGLSGVLTIDTGQGDHRYAFLYELPKESGQQAGHASHPSS